jgi:hypothetical protein
MSVSKVQNRQRALKGFLDLFFNPNELNPALCIVRVFLRIYSHSSLE